MDTINEINLILLALKTELGLLSDSMGVYLVYAFVLVVFVFLVFVISIIKNSIKG
jgi:hypothetical protein